MMGNKERIEKRISLDVNIAGFVGEARAIETEKAISMFVVDAEEFYCSTWLISHQGNYDFFLQFGRLRIYKEEFIVDLVCVFSPLSLLLFLKAIRKFSKEENIRLSIPYKQKNNEVNENETIKKGMAFSELC